MSAARAEWEMATAGEAGFADDLDARVTVARDAGCLPNVHGIVAVRGGRIFCERYFVGLDAALARPLGVVRFAHETLHDMRSVSKSIVGLLYGIALAGGRVPPPQADLLAQFPEYPDLADAPDRRALTIAHVLTMTLGTEWDELSLPYSDPRNSEIAMERAPDRYRFVLDRPISGPPGMRWTYNGGATALLGRLIAKGTGGTLEAFAREALFDPLGIGPVSWARGMDGEPMAASGLRMTVRDLARVGVAVLDAKRGTGTGAIPADWVAASLTPAVSLPDGRRYGYHWYLGSTPLGDGPERVRWEETVSAVGNGGQRLFVFPRLDLVVAITAGNYDAPDQWRPPQTVVRDVVLPALLRP
jgi:CubicO group peptidase (beta-lactamase class C family)